MEEQVWSAVVAALLDLLSNGNCLSFPSTVSYRQDAWYSYSLHLLDICNIARCCTFAIHQATNSLLSDARPVDTMHLHSLLLYSSQKIYLVWIEAIVVHQITRWFRTMFPMLNSLNKLLAAALVQSHETSRPHCSSANKKCKNIKRCFTFKSKFQ